MEELLLRLARQLDALDEASLMSLWDTYAKKVQRFEPSERWQEAVLVLSFIQAKRWKNQLFNAQWAARTRNAKGNTQPGGPPPQSAFTLEKPDDAPRKTRRAKVLDFRPRAHSD